MEKSVREVKRKKKYGIDIENDKHIACIYVYKCTLLYVLYYVVKRRSAFVAQLLVQVLILSAHPLPYLSPLH